MTKDHTVGLWTMKRWENERKRRATVYKRKRKEEERESVKVRELLEREIRKVKVCA